MKKYYCITSTGTDNTTGELIARASLVHSGTKKDTGAKYAYLDKYPSLNLSGNYTIGQIVCTDESVCEDK